MFEICFYWFSLFGYQLILQFYRVHITIFGPCARHWSASLVQFLNICYYWSLMFQNPPIWFFFRVVITSHPLNVSESTNITMFVFYFYLIKGSSLLASHTTPPHPIHLLPFRPLHFLIFPTTMLCVILLLQRLSCWLGMSTRTGTPCHIRRPCQLKTTLLWRCN